jgi:hypothetical protein
MNLLATVVELATTRGERRRAHDTQRVRRTRTPWPGPELPVTWMDGTPVLPEGGFSFGDNPTRSPR